MNEKQYDAIIVGAGVGGLSVGTLLAKEGLKVLMLEQCDRPGGRALSVRGEEISEKGLEWYRDLLAKQFSYIADSQPNVATIVDNRLLDGYTLDIGYHAISANGAGYMLDFEDLIGGLPEVAKHGAMYGNYFQGKLYRDVAGSFIDPNLKKIGKEMKIPFLSFYTDAYGLPEEEIDRLEKVSFQEWADGKGITKSDVLFDHLHSVGTLFSTINDPKDISMGDIFRYFKHAFGPKLTRGVLGWVGGFVGNGTMEWSKAVARKIEGFGGEIRYTAYLPLTEKESRNRELVDKIIRRLPEFMEEIYPGFRDSVDWKLDLVCWKLEGVAKSISQAGTQKVPVRSEHVGGLFFAGDTAKGYGVAMDCAIASGVICAGEILGKDFGIR